MKIPNWRKPKIIRVLVVQYVCGTTDEQDAKVKKLIQDYRDALFILSNKYLQYEIVHTEVCGDFPLLANGRRYDDQDYASALKNGEYAYRMMDKSYPMMDYDVELLRRNVYDKISRDEVDEVWMFGGPYLGFYESRMVGKDSWWVNAPELYHNCKQFIVMGFNVTRELEEMLHSFGHRVESMLDHKVNPNPASLLKALYNKANDFRLREDWDDWIAEEYPVLKSEWEVWLKTHGTVHHVPGGAEHSQRMTVWLGKLLPKWWPVVARP